MKIYETNLSNIKFSGDLHGKFDRIIPSLKKYNIKNCCIVVCGDVGIGFYNKQYYENVFNDLDKSLKEKNVHLYMFRGNHDNKDFFDGDIFNKYDNVNIIPDYSVIISPLQNILCVGGAVSIDRSFRIKKEKEINSNLYWTNEQITYDENELKSIDENNIKIDVVCTHTCTSFAYPNNKKGIAYWLIMDKELEKDLTKERNNCDLILNYLTKHKHPIKKWYYGHFHNKHVENINGISYTLIDMTKQYMDII